MTVAEIMRQSFEEAGLLSKSIPDVDLRARIAREFEPVEPERFRLPQDDDADGEPRRFDVVLLANKVTSQDEPIVAMEWATYLALLQAARKIAHHEEEE